MDDNPRVVQNHHTKDEFWVGIVGRTSSTVDAYPDLPKGRGVGDFRHRVSPAGSIVSGLSTSGSKQGGRAAAPLPALAPAHLSCSGGFSEWLLRYDISLAFTSYQSGRLYLVGVDGEHRVAVHEVHVGRAMGLWADPQRLILAAKSQVWRFENVLAAGQTLEGADRHFMPRIA